jgi:hypothetical protein
MVGFIYFLLFLSIFTLAYNFLGHYINLVIIKFAEIFKFVLSFLSWDVAILFFRVILVLIFKKILKI